MRGDIPRPKDNSLQKGLKPGPAGIEGKRQVSSSTTSEGTDKAAVPRTPNPRDLARILEEKKQASPGTTSEGTDKSVPRTPNPGDLARQLREGVETASRPGKGTDVSTHRDQTHSSQGSKEMSPATDRPVARAGPPTPADLARQLKEKLTSRLEAAKSDDSNKRSSRDGAKEVAGTSVPRDVSARGEQAERTNTISSEKSSLAQQLGGTGLESHVRTKKHLDRLDQIAVSSLPGSLQEVTTAARSELSKAIGYYKDGRINEASLQEVIGRIGGTYTMYLQGVNYPEQRLVDKTSGAVSELRHINRLVESNLATSEIISGAQLGREYTLNDLTTGATERIHTAPVRDADTLYQGRDGKVHIDEIKETVNALRSTLRKGSDQLQNLANWRDQAPEKREAGVVLDRPTRWTNLFEPIDAKQPASPCTADLLVEHRIPIRIGNATFTPENLVTLKGQVQRAVGGASGTRREELLGRLSRFFPKDVEQGKFQR